MSKKKSDPKINSLKELRTLNSHPGKVSDELFRSHEFFDSRDLVQVKYEMLRRVKEDGWTISQAAAAYGVSRPSFYQAQVEFNHAGLAGFMPERRGPRHAHKLSEEVVAFIEELRSNDTSVRMSALIHQVKEKFGINVHRRSVERALSRSKKKP